MIVRRVVLHNTEGNHNKYYELTLESVNDGEFNVTARWGRIEHFKTGSPQSQVKEKKVAFWRANSTMDDLRHAKLKKGYKLVMEQDEDKVSYPIMLVKGGFQSVAKTKSAAKTEVNAKTKKAAKPGSVAGDFDRTDHEVLGNWWNMPLTLGDREI